MFLLTAFQQVYNILSLLGFIIVLTLFLFWCYQFYLPKNYVSGLGSKHVLITGCDTGFGNALAKQLDSLGVRVFAACLTEVGESKLKEECSANVTPLRMDVTNDNSIAEAYDKVTSLLPKDAVLWGIVNNAGTAHHLFTAELLSIEEFKRVLDVNLFGCVRVMKQFLPLLKQSQGRIVNMISLAGKISPPLMSAYAMSKHALEAFTDSTRVELMNWGVSVHAIEPSFFATSMTQAEDQIESFEKAWSELSPAMKEEYEDHKPNVCQIFKTMGKSCETDISPVLNAMEHALLSKSAKIRYMVGKDHLYKYSFVSLLPSIVLDPLHHGQLLNFVPKSRKEI